MRKERKTLTSLFVASLLIFLFCLFTACAIFPKQHYSEIQALVNIDYGFAPSLTLPDPESLFVLSEKQQSDFLLWFHSAKHATTPAHRRLYNYLERETYNFNWQAATHSASKTLEVKNGNCLSLAIVTTALAQLAKLDIEYQFVDASPVFEQQGNTLIRGVHIRSKLYANKDDVRGPYEESAVIIDYFPGEESRFLGNVNFETFRSLYYSNLAGELLAANDNESAYWYARKAVELTPYHTSNLNNYALALRRLGKVEDAEALYKTGIKWADQPLVMLKNYRALLLQQGREEEARALDKKISAIDDASPYPWLNLADSAFRENNYRRAKRFYIKARDLAPYLQYAWLGLARVALAEGEKKEALRFLTEARIRSSASANNRIYDAKISLLEKTGGLQLNIEDTR